MNLGKSPFGQPISIYGLVPASPLLCRPDDRVDLQIWSLCRGESETAVSTWLCASNANLPDVVCVWKIQWNGGALLSHEREFRSTPWLIKLAATSAEVTTYPCLHSWALIWPNPRPAANENLSAWVSQCRVQAFTPVGVDVKPPRVYVGLYSRRCLEEFVDCLSNASGRCWLVQPPVV